jgi:hypothetical protein
MKLVRQAACFSVVPAFIVLSASALSAASPPGGPPSSIPFVPPSTLDAVPLFVQLSCTDVVIVTCSTPRGITPEHNESQPQSITNLVPAVVRVSAKNLPLATGATSPFKAYIDSLDTKAVSVPAVQSALDVVMPLVDGDPAATGALQVEFYPTLDVLGRDNASRAMFDVHADRGPLQVDVYLERTLPTPSAAACLVGTPVMLDGAPAVSRRVQCSGTSENLLSPPLP